MIADYFSASGRVTWKLLGVWVCVVTMCLLVVWRQLDTLADAQISQEIVPHVFDGIVFIAAGEMAADKVVEFSIKSFRKLGKWQGPIYVLTDHPECFQSTSANLNLNLISVPPQSSILKIKSLKTQIFAYLPESSIRAVLYVDADVIASKPLDDFIFDLAQTLTQHPKAAVGMFYDAQGHMLRMCLGCDTWHTGIIFLQREGSATCLKAWEQLLVQETFSTDQEAMDKITSDSNTRTQIRTGTNPPDIGQAPCTSVVTALPTRHLLFAKDYVAWLLSPHRTFIHVTAASRLHTQGWFYTHLVVPNIMKSLHLSTDEMSGSKQCLSKS